MEGNQPTSGVPEQARLGAYVAVELIDEQGNVEPLAFDIVREEYADFERGRLGVQTPLAKAILGNESVVEVSINCNRALTTRFSSP